MSGTKNAYIHHRIYIYTCIQKCTSSLQVFTGNTDRDTIVANTFQQPVIARYIRVNPIAFNNYITMRWELTGCSGRLLIW